jgi:hypothetical protein
MFWDLQLQQRYMILEILVGGLEAQLWSVRNLSGGVWQISVTHLMV